MGLAEQLVLGAQLDDLLLPWRIELQVRHLIHYPGLLDHIDRVGIPFTNEGGEGPCSGPA
jgi:hypothetical protein